MRIPRRTFLGNVACSVGSLYLPTARGAGCAVPGRDESLDCALVDLSEDCLLRESLEGYKKSLGAGAACWEGIPHFTGRPKVVILPGVGTLNDATASALIDLLTRGCRVLLESGAAFSSPSAFVEHQRALLSYFDLAVGSPVDLWAEDGKQGGPSSGTPGEGNTGRSIPYVNYLWPRETMVRDFSRAIPVLTKGVEVIGRMPGFPVAVRKRVGNGLLIFLGSPLGPALRAGDSEGLLWMRSLTAPGPLDAGEASLCQNQPT